jgi:hypothetical protein
MSKSFQPNPEQGHYYIGCTVAWRGLYAFFAALAPRLVYATKIGFNQI